MTDTDADVGFVDCDVHNALAKPADLVPYLDPRWREVYEQFGTWTLGATSFIPTRPRAFACRADSVPPGGGPPGSDLDLLRAQLLDQWDIRYAVLGPIEQLRFGQSPSAYSAGLTRALNRWTQAEWLDQDPRLLAAICIPFECPDLAAEELEYWRSDRRFVQALFNLRTSQPLGSRKYWPLYEAAEALGLPVAVHVGGFAGNPMTGGGWPSYYFEEHAGYCQGAQAHVVSLLCEGVFERFPGLRFVFQECGFAWVGPLAWRLDHSARLLSNALAEFSVAPSELLHRHCWYTTQPVEEPERPEFFNQMLEQFDLSDRLIFSSDYPHWDFDAPDMAIPRSLPSDVRQAIHARNASGLYGLDQLVPA